jgi:heme-degrading monooxygenase HmoA
MDDPGKAAGADQVSGIAPIAGGRDRWHGEERSDIWWVPADTAAHLGELRLPRGERRVSGVVKCMSDGHPRIFSVTVVKINAITVPRERFDEFTDRFASRAGKVEESEGFEGFELLRPNDDRDVCLVITRWRSEQDFQAWVRSADFASGHSQHRERGPVGTSSELWSFDVLEPI